MSLKLWPINVSRHYNYCGTAFPSRCHVHRHFSSAAGNAGGGGMNARSGNAETWWHTDVTSLQSLLVLQSICSATNRQGPPNAMVPWKAELRAIKSCDLNRFETMYWNKKKIYIFLKSHLVIVALNFRGGKLVQVVLCKCTAKGGGRKKKKEWKWQMNIWFNFANVDFSFTQSLVTINEGMFDFSRTPFSFASGYCAMPTECWPESSSQQKSAAFALRLFCAILFGIWNVSCVCILYAVFQSSAFYEINWNAIAQLQPRKTNILLLCVFN